MKLLVVGHLCIDSAHPPGGNPRRRWGGIANAIAAIGSLAGQEDTVVPICGVGKEDEAEFLSWLGHFPAVDPSGVFSLAGPTNSIDVYEKEGGTRVACTGMIAPPVPFESLRRFLSADGILINMASGSDVTLETLDQIRMEIRARETPIHLDFHNLTTDIGPGRERVRRPLEQWRRWAFMLRTVQMSEEEAAGLTVDRLSEAQLIGHLLTLGIGGVVITRGARGATLFWSEHKKVMRHDCAGRVAEGSVGEAGPGDVFGGAFLYRLVATADMKEAAEFANVTASRAASFLEQEWMSRA
jgi:sugar/nucleoside kinase (ribokinase family)